MRIGRLTDPSYFSDMVTNYGPDAPLRIRIDTILDRLLDEGYPPEAIESALKDKSVEEALAYLLAVYVSSNNRSLEGGETNNLESVKVSALSHLLVLLFGMRPAYTLRATDEPYRTESQLPEPKDHISAIASIKDTIEQARSDNAPFAWESVAERSYAQLERLSRDYKILHNQVENLEKRIDLAIQALLPLVEDPKTE